MTTTESTVPRDAVATLDDGLGFVATEPTSVDLLAAMFRAARKVSKKRKRIAIQKRMMKVDWSWTEPAKRYRKLYRELISLD